MNYMLPLLIGFFAAALGTSLPGMLNITAAKISAFYGKKPAVVYALGAVTIAGLQSLLSALFAKYLDKHPEVIVLLEEVGIFIFFILTIYFFSTGKKNKKKEAVYDQDKPLYKQFGLGALLSSVNVFPIPYYVFIALTCSAKDWFPFDFWPLAMLVFGVMLGTFLLFYAYILFFKPKEGAKEEVSFIMKNANYIIGSITGIIAIFTVVKLIKPYLGY
ncbi:MAG: LysE family transporter [Flavobacterium sp.]|nr:LysE family transporter [Candidatus Neoflavobacterium equi]